MQERRVVITGLGALTPVGLGVEAFWTSLLEGVSGADYITKFDASKFPTKFACELKDFKPTDYLSRKEIRRMDDFAVYGVIAAKEAIEDAKLHEYSDLDKQRVGVIIGSGIGGIKTFQDELLNYFRGNLDSSVTPETARGPRFSPFFIPKMIIDIASGHISMMYGFMGPNFSCVSACATASNSIGEAFLLIKQGLADVMIAGGSESAITEAGVGGFNAMKALSTRNDDPKTASRPFDKDRDGFVLGEGAGILVLEEYEHAKKRGAKIYAELKGIGLSADAYHLTAPHPEGLGAKLVMENAIKFANLKPEDIDYINMHGTSTPLGDIAETKAIKKVFGEHAYKMNVSSTKSMTGHLLGAAGGIEAIATVLAVVNDIVPPTINHFTDDPECDLNYTFNKPQERTVNAAISNTFGFGGHNASILFTKIRD